MTSRSLALILGMVVTTGLAGVLMAQKAAGPAQAPARGKSGTPQAKTAQADAPAVKLEKATFGGGCFWCQEAVFERVPGVKSVVSGFAGGTVPHPSYEMVCTGLTGHAEVVQVEYDPAVVSFDDLLTIFWRAHDPTTFQRQGPDVGPQYRSIILYDTDDQNKAAEKSFEKLTAAHVFPGPIVTELVPLTKFYPAERHHQDYYRRHRNEVYSQEEIAPKLRRIKPVIDRLKLKPDGPAPAP